MVPFGFAGAEAVRGTEVSGIGSDFYIVVLRSLFLAFVIAGLSVALGYIPGKLLALGGRCKGLLLLLLIVPLVLPRYVQYYCWSLLLSPTTALGRFLSSNPDVARTIGIISSSMVLVLWYWPLASLVLAHGWKNLGQQVLDIAQTEANNSQTFRYIVLPLLKRNIVLCYVVCFVLILSEFATFHLAGIRTIGTELAVLYELTGSQAVTLRAGWPMIAVAGLVGYFMHLEVVHLKKTETISETCMKKTAKA